MPGLYRKIWPATGAARGIGPDRAAAMGALVAGTPFKRFGRPVAVAAIAVMLASDETTYITGTEVNIDDGLLAGLAAMPG